MSLRSYYRKKHFPGYEHTHLWLVLEMPPTLSFKAGYNVEGIYCQHDNLDGFPYASVKQWAPCKLYEVRPMPGERITCPHCAVAADAFKKWLASGGANQKRSNRETSLVNARPRWKTGKRR